MLLVFIISVLSREDKEKLTLCASPSSDNSILVVNVLSRRKVCRGTVIINFEGSIEEHDADVVRVRRSVAVGVIIFMLLKKSKILFKAYRSVYDMCNIEPGDIGAM